jgi:hypothetical protein
MTAFPIGSSEPSRALRSIGPQYACARLPGYYTVLSPGMRPSPRNGIWTGYSSVDEWENSNLARVA